jgi:hypothetical protein
MKMTNTQIRALAEKLTTEINEKVKIKNAELLSEENFMKWLPNNQEIAALVWGITDRIAILKDMSKQKGHYAFPKMPEDFLKEEFKKGLKLSQTVNISEIQNAIIIETIECGNLNEIVEKITSKYI